MIEAVVSSGVMRITGIDANDIHIRFTISPLKTVCKCRSSPLSMRKISLKISLNGYEELFAALKCRRFYNVDMGTRDFIGFEIGLDYNSRVIWGVTLASETIIRSLNQMDTLLSLLDFQVIIIWSFVKPSLIIYLLIR